MSSSHAHDRPVPSDDDRECTDDSGHGQRQRVNRHDVWELRGHARQLVLVRGEVMTLCSAADAAVRS